MDKADFYYKEAQKFKAQNDLESALEYFQKALKINPNYVETYISMGILFYRQEKLKEALKCFEKAIEMQPDHALAYTNAGGALLKLGDLHKALKCNQKALKITPNDSNLHRNIGYILHALRKLDEAVTHYQKALQLNPNYADAWNNIGNVFKELNKHEQAYNAYQKALKIKPNYVDALNNMGNLFKDKNEITQALDYYQKALNIQANYAPAHSNQSLAFLVNGDFHRGWQEYEWRFKANPKLFPQFQAPIWDGSPLQGKRLLIYHEQGLGDSIQFCRYLPLIQGSTVIFVCQTELKHLLKNLSQKNLTIIDGVTAQKNKLTFDTWLYLLSLPHIFKTTLDTIPAQIPYLFADTNKVAQWKARFSNSHFNIGIVWTGSPKHPKDSIRSCPLSHFLELSKIQGIKLYSLQKGEAAKQIDSKSISLINLDNELKDFTDTAAVIECLDLVISIDTAVAHLVGAMGKFVWVLLPFAPDWRWMLNREDSPWYPTMRLFRQPKPKDWDSVFVQVLEELRKKIGQS